ncbi:hypothetical protein CBS101457_002311 [Exobasidium rhododendri]|nr:hypothetical protein CBS101457_002311 [Exobasidium rhododendri]
MSSRGSPSTHLAPLNSLPVSLLASTVAGGLEPLISYPFEFVKTAQQLHNTHDNFKVEGIEPNTEADVKRAILGNGKESKRIGFLPVIRNVYRNEGIKGFYHGVSVVATGGAVKAVIRLGTYDRLKRALQMPDGSLSGGRSLLAGLGAGLAEAVFVVIPTETLKTRVIHSNLLYEPPVKLSGVSSFNAAKILVNSPGYHGYRALYTGVTSTLLRQGVSSMLRFGTYSTLKNFVAGSTRPGQKLPSGVTFGIGALAGAITVCE